MQDPLKQGLKREVLSFIPFIAAPIRMQDPLKQGLKLQPSLLYQILMRNSNARSTKTRIETSYICRLYFLQGQIRMQDPLKQGLKHIFFVSIGKTSSPFECKIH